TTATYITSSTPPHLLLFFLLLSVFFHSTYPSVLFFFNATAPTEIYTLSLHDALPISVAGKDLERFSDLVAGDDVHDGREHPCRFAGARLPRSRRGLKDAAQARRLAGQDRHGLPVAADAAAVNPRLTQLHRHIVNQVADLEIVC